MFHLEIQSNYYIHLRVSSVCKILTKNCVIVIFIHKLMWLFRIVVLQKLMLSFEMSITFGWAQILTMLFLVLLLVSVFQGILESPKSHFNSLLGEVWLAKDSKANHLMDEKISGMDHGRIISCCYHICTVLSHA